MTEKKTEIKRHNRLVGLSEAANGVLDPVFRKRGFANRDLFARWGDIVPAPYNQTTQPDRLFWPRGDNGAEGAVLYLRCAPGAAMAVSHDSERIREAVNFYFGYFLVRGIKLSAEPFEMRKPSTENPPDCPEEIKAEVDTAVAEVGNTALREALRHLGENMKSRRK